jgi:hypothetical protein
MKKFLVLLAITAALVLALGLYPLSYSQDSAKEEKPTFYRLIPGVYVNGWPRFTITYPKDWVEGRPHAHEVFRTYAPGAGQRAGFSVAPYPGPLPVDNFADLLLQIARTIGKDVAIVSDKPSLLRDGTPVREVELKMVLNDEPMSMMALAVQKGDLQMHWYVFSFSGKIGEDLKAILYSIQYEPSKDKLVKVPPDVQEFLDRWRNDIVSHDVAKVMTHYSDRYLNSGDTKGEVERSQKQYISLVTSFEVGITEFVPAGDRAYLAGFQNVNGAKHMLIETSIIKESGEWKWYGNQRDVSP